MYLSKVKFFYLPFIPPQTIYCSLMDHQMQCTLYPNILWTRNGSWQDYASGDGGEFLFGIPEEKGHKSPCSSQRVFELFNPIIMKILGLEDYKLVPVSKLIGQKQEYGLSNLRWKPTLPWTYLPLRN